MHKEMVQVFNEVRADQKEGKHRTDLLHARVCDRRYRRRYLVNFLAVMFGIGTVIGLSGMFAEAPLLVISAPEGSTLPSVLSMAMVTAFTGPALYALLNSSISGVKNRYEYTWILSLFIVGSVTMGLLAFFHDVTITINAVDRSILLLILVFILGSITGSRNILFLPYLQNFEEVNLASFHIGEGLSGFIPSIVALIQGIGGDPGCRNNTTNSTNQSLPYIPPPNFPPRDYFLFLTALLAASTFSIWLLEYLRIRTIPKERDAQFLRDYVSAKESNCSRKLLDHESADETRGIEMKSGAGLTPTDSAATPPGKSITKNERIYLCVLMCLICFVSNGYLHTIEAFSSRPYGNSAYHLVVNLGQLANTLTCVLGYWVPPIGIRGVTGITFLMSIATSYVTWLALSSPTPLWRDTTHGVILLVTTWVLLMGLISYVKLAITVIIWQESSKAAMYQLGVANLFGSICGSTLTFVFINFTTVFTPYTPCKLLE